MRRSVRPRDPTQLRRSADAPRAALPRAAALPSPAAERAVLVGILLPHSKADPSNPLGELASLAQSAGVTVVDHLVQKRMSLNAATGLGKGKVGELGERIVQAGANVVIFDSELAPRQIRELENALHCKVIDRSELILDIFASRAKTREAQLQVELAQLEYTAPRLRGMWSHLERIAGAGGGTGAGVVGGVGTRGPGERQIEIDRRIVRGRISYLKREIGQVDARKRREVRARVDQFTVSLVGYTNSGKTTLLNRLAGADQFAADMLFATLDTKTVRWALGDGQTVLLSDTVGFIRDLPHALVASFRATLEEAIHADLLLHVVDVSQSSAWRQIEAVEEVLTELDCQSVPQILVLNKMDVADDAAMVELLARRDRAALAVSAKTGAGLGELTAEVIHRVRGDTADVTVRIGQTDGKLLAILDKLAIIRGRRYHGESIELDIRIHKTQLQQLLARHSGMELLNGKADDDDRPCPDGSS